MNKDNNSIVITKDLTRPLSGWFVIFHPSGSLNFYNNERKIIWKFPLDDYGDIETSAKKLFTMMNSKMKAKIDKVELEYMDSIFNMVKAIGLSGDFIAELVNSLGMHNTDEEFIKELDWWPHWLKEDEQYKIVPARHQRRNRKIPIKVDFKTARDWIFTLILKACEESFNLNREDETNKAEKRYDSY